MGRNWESRDRKREKKRQMKVDGRGLMRDYPNALRKKAREVDDARAKRAKNE